MRKTEKINKIFDNRVTWIIMSLILSFFVWAHLAGSDTTTFDQTFTNVPVVFEGADTLRTTRGLIITNPDAETVTVEVRGSRAEIGSLHASELQAIVDVSGISQARETELTYTISFPDRVNRSEIEVVKRSPSTIGFTVAAESTKTIEVTGAFTGNVKEGYKTGEIVVEPSTITLYGPESELENIERAVVYIQRDNVDATVGPVKTDYVLLDKAGNEASPQNVMCDTKTVTATLPVLVTKELQLTVNLIEGGGATADDCVIEISPATIQVTGDTAALQQLNQIVVGTVNLADFITSYENKFTIPLDNALSNESGESEATVKITVKGLETKRITTKNISVTGAPEDMNVAVNTSSLVVTVRAKSDVLKQIEERNVRVVIDLTDYAGTTGTVSVPANIYIDGFENAGAVQSYPISVTLSRK